jgi:spore coat polysaccharide biosynthesis protein SpsF (cytidylyltransferase family)
MKKGIIITVRSASSRLQEKCYEKILNRCAIEYVIDQAKKSNLADVIVLCTTQLTEDDRLCKIASDSGIEFYRGSVKDKLERWRGACLKYDIDFFVTADGDDLFCDPKLMDLAFEQYEKSQDSIDFIKSDDVVCGSFTYGIKSKALYRVCEIKDTTDTEMMWVYFTETNLFDVKELENIPKIFLRKDIRMTLDYQQDLDFFKNVIEHFGNNNFTSRELFEYLDSNKSVIEINYFLENMWKQNQINKTNLILKEGESNEKS